MARRLPAVQRKIAEARQSTLTSVCNDMAKSVAGHEFIKSLPEKGLSRVMFLHYKDNYFHHSLNQEELIKRLEQYRKFEINYQSGQVSGCVYKLAKSDMAEIYNKVI